MATPTASKADATGAGRGGRFDDGLFLAMPPESPRLASRASRAGADDARRLFYRYLRAPAITAGRERRLCNTSAADVSRRRAISSPTYDADYRGDRRLARQRDIGLRAQQARAPANEYSIGLSAGREDFAARDAWRAGAPGGRRRWPVCLRATRCLARVSRRRAYQQAVISALREMRRQHYGKSPSASVPPRERRAADQPPRLIATRGAEHLPIFTGSRASPLGCYSDISAI